MIMKIKLFIIMRLFSIYNAFIIPAPLVDNLILSNHNNLNPEIINPIVSISTLGLSYHLVKQINNLDLNSNFTRKIVHIVSGPLFISTWGLYNTENPIFWSSIVPVISSFYLINNKDKLKSTLSRNNNSKEILSGPLIYCLIIWIINLFYFQNYIGIVTICQLAFGDGFSDIIGRKFGNNKLIYNSNKSLEGSLGFLLFGWLGTISTLKINNSLFRYHYPIDIIDLFLITIVLTIIETIPKFDDNISIPITGLILLNYLSMYK